MANNVRITASINDQVSGPIDRIKDKFTTLGKSEGFKSVLQGVGIGSGISAYNALGSAVDKVTGFIFDSADAYREDARSQAQLRAALEANVAGWNGNADAIEKVISSRMRLGFGDEEQRDSLGRLVGITHDATKALELEGEAMDLARLRGIDLASASDIVGKVYGGNIGILSRYGIVVQKGATATQALAQIQKMAAGQAEAYANTDLGKLEAAQIKVGEAQERLGEAMAKFETVILPPLADAISGLVDLVTAVGANMDKLTPVIVAVGAVLTTKLVVGLANTAAGFIASGAAALGFGTAAATAATEAEAAGAASVAAANASKAAWSSALGPVALFSAGVAEAAKEATDFAGQRHEFASDHDLSNAQALAVQLSKMTEQQRRYALAHGAANEFIREGTTYTEALSQATAKLTGVNQQASRDTDKLGASLSDMASASDEAKAKAELSAAGIRNLSTSFEQTGAAASEAGREVQARMAMAKKGVDSFAASSPGLLEIAKAMRAPIDAARAMRSGVDGEFTQLLDDFDHFKSNTGRIAELAGQLLNKKFVKAVHDGRPDVKQEAEAYQLDALGELQKLVAAGGKVGKDGMRALEAAMKSENPEIAAIATLIYNTANKHLPGKPLGTKHGKDTGQGVADGINSKTGDTGPIARAIKHIPELVNKFLPSEIDTTIKVNVQASGHMRALASGGRIAPGETVLVGEAGPELAKGIPGGGAIITPLGAGRSPARSFGGLSPAMATAGAGLTFVYAPGFSTASAAEAQRFVEQAGPALLRYLKSRGFGTR